MKANKLINGTAVFSINGQEIKVPVSEILEYEDLEADKILEDAEDDRDLQWELQDIAYEYLTSNLNINIVP